MKKYSPEEIVKGVKNKKATIFKFLAEHYGPMIIGHVRKNSGQEEDGREVIQITFVRFWLAIKKGRYKETGKLDQYIFQLAANIWREELKRKKRRPTDTLEERIFNITDNSKEELARAIVKDKKLNAIELALKDTGDPCRKIITWFHLEQISLLEIAERLSYDYNSLRKRIFDCRKKLKGKAGKILNSKKTT